MGNDHSTNQSCYKDNDSLLKIIYPHLSNDEIDIDSLSPIQVNRLAKKFYEKVVNRSIPFYRESSHDPLGNIYSISIDKQSTYPINFDNLRSELKHVTSESDVDHITIEENGNKNYYKVHDNYSRTHDCGANCPECLGKFFFNMNGGAFNMFGGGDDDDDDDDSEEKKDKKNKKEKKDKKKEVKKNKKDSSEDDDDDDEDDDEDDNNDDDDDDDDDDEDLDDIDADDIDEDGFDTTINTSLYEKMNRVLGEDDDDLNDGDYTDRMQDAMDAIDSRQQSRHTRHSDDSSENDILDQQSRHQRRINPKYMQ